MTDRDRARAALEEAAALHRAVALGEAVEAIVRAAGIVRDAIGDGRQVLVCGNGGSATDAQHLAAELVGRFRRPRGGLAAVALTADSAVVTSIANDFGFDVVFARQVEAIGRPGDVVIGVTTSGRSPNVNAALSAARSAGLKTVAITGRDGGDAGPLADVHVNVPADDTARIQEVHRTLVHVLCDLVETP
ncbi:MAG: SIS domain-containing protein [Vicinamibacterales bacterium]